MSNTQTTRDAVYLAAKYASRRSVIYSRRCVVFARNGIYALGDVVAIWIPSPEDYAGPNVPHAVDAKDLVRALRAVPEATILFSDDGVAVSDGRHTAKLQVIIGSEVDDFYDVEDVQWSDLPEDLDWNACGDAVVHAVCQDVMRPGLAGVCVDGGRMVATDGHRLAMVVDADLPKLSALVPQQLVDVPFVPVSVGEDSSHRRLFLRSGDGVVICGQYMEGTPPVYERVLDGLKNGVDITVDRLELAAALKLADVVGVAIATVDYRDGFLVIRDCSRRLECTTEVDCEVRAEVSSSDPVPTIGMSPAYMLDAIRVLESDSVVMSVFGDLSPVKFSSDDPSDGDVFLVMPSRID